MRLLWNTTGTAWRPLSSASSASIALTLLFAIFVGVPAPVHARPSDHIALELDAPEACVDERVLRDRINARLGAAFDTDTELYASARVEQLAPAVYQLQLRYRTLGGAQDERSLRGESCAAVADALAFLLSLALSPREAPGVIAEPSEPLLSPSVAVLGELDSAVMSRLALGLGVMLGVRAGAWELFVRAQLFFPRSVSERGAVTTFDALSADLGLCRPFRWGNMSLAPCARAELGQLSGEVQGAILDERPGAARFQALGLGGLLRVRLAAPLWLMLSAEFTWFLRRPQFVVTALGEVGRPDLFGTRVVLGPLLTW